jgi:hypothetical protein
MEAKWGSKGDSSHPLVFLFGLAAVSLLGLLLRSADPAAQDLSRFADQRTAARHPEFLERGFQPAVHLVGAAGLADFAATCRPAFSFSACS